MASKFKNLFFVSDEKEQEKLKQEKFTSKFPDAATSFPTSQPTTLSPPPQGTNVPVECGPHMDSIMKLYEDGFAGLNRPGIEFYDKPYVFILKIEPYYVTHQVIINPQLESEMRELHNRIKSQGLMPKISKIMGWKNDLEWVDRRRLLIERGVEKLTKEEVVGQGEWCWDYDDGDIVYD